MRLGAIFRRAARTRRGIAGILVGLAGVGLGISAAFVGPAAHATGAVQLRGPAVPVTVAARLDAIALRAAKANGDPRPDWITVVLTTQGKADALAGSTEPTGNDVAVYVITMKGSFTAYLASPPSGATLPTGTYLSLVVNARSFRGLDFGLSNHPPTVSPASLGPVYRLAP